MDKFNYLKDYLSYISNNDLRFHELYCYENNAFMRVEILNGDIFTHLSNIIGIGKLTDFTFIPEYNVYHKLFALIAIHI